MKNTIYFDVDDTLVRSYGKSRIPISAAIAQVRALSESGADLYLWSSGGAEYCRLTAQELGIEDCFTAFLPKPTIYVDDQPVHEWRLCKHLYPGQVANAIE
jgi:FMN phosphatase YigB (HAD superfamily)